MYLNLILRNPFPKLYKAGQKSVNALKQDNPITVQGVYKLACKTPHNVQDKENSKSKVLT